MEYFSSLWTKIKNNGCKPEMAIEYTKTIVFTNTLLTITVLAYLAFSILIAFLGGLGTRLLLFSTGSMLFGFLLVFILIKNYRSLIAKNLLLLLIFSGIAFYDYNIGKSAGVSLYYFAFFFVAINIFSFKKEKPFLILHLLLPLLLITITEIYFFNETESTSHRNGITSIIYLFNFCMTFLIIALNVFVIIKENIVFQKSIELSTLNIQSLIDNTKGFIWSINMNHKLTAFNTAYKNIIKKHYDEDCTIGYDVNRILTKPNNAKEIINIYNKVLKGESFNSEYFSNGNHFEIQASPLYNVENVQIGATFHSRIVTAKRIAEQQLQQEKINIETLIDSIGNSTWSIGKDFKIIAASKLYISDMKRIFGVDIIPGFDVSQLFSLPDYPKDWRSQYDTVFNGKNLYLDYVFNDDYFELNAVPIRNIKNEVVGAVFFSRNITDRKKTEQELDKARIEAEEATLEKAQFLSNMSHELRTPLNGIIGLTNILVSEEILPSQKKHLDVLKYSSDHMLVLINDILDFNKIEAGKVILENDSFNLLETIEKIKSFFLWEADSKGLNFEVTTNNHLNRTVKGDATRIRQVLTNLISNAIKFTEKGFVKFSIDILEQLSEKQCKLRFSISDSGIGIANNKLEKIFESFGQADQSTIRKYGGSGLGLTISKKLIALMNSTLHVESALEKGSHFWFDLVVDCSITNEVLPIQKNINELEPFENVSVLVAEDNPINMLVVCKMLEKWKVQVHKAKNGVEAVTFFLNNTVSLILMDLQMPEMDGLTATKLIREKNITTPIIALTATTEESLTNNLDKKGINGIIQKPFVPEDLYNKIKTLVAHKE
jgi:signal transduction histidine kinase/CheY-like chemotaxis protein